MTPEKKQVVPSRKESPFDLGYENKVGFNESRNVDQKLVANVCQEMMKMFKGKRGVIEDKTSASSSHAHAVTIPHKDKFDKRGTKCVLLGYPLNQKGYTLYNLETVETFHSRDVIFEDSVFPFKDCNKHTPPMVTNEFHTFGGEEYADNPTINSLNSPNIVISNTPNSSTLVVVDSVSTVPSSSTNAAPPEQVRRSTKQTNKPVWLKDFVDPTVNKSTPHYHLFVSIDFLGIPKPHVFLANVFSNPKPSRYKQVVHYTGWRQAMDKELAALKKNNTWIFTVLPPGHKPISSKSVYKTKYNPDGTIERLNARLVVRGFNQQERIKSQVTNHLIL
nr:hypothetical protein [Tanacetum cinerariifolium]